MKLTKVNIIKTIENAQALIETDKQISPALKAMFQLLLILITLLAERLSLNSANSSKPPSTDPNRRKGKKDKEDKNKRKPGGQPGHNGRNLGLIDNPDHIIPLKLDKRTLPRGHYQEVSSGPQQMVVNSYQNSNSM